MVNIRSTLKAGLASLLIGLSSCSKSEPTEAETYFHNFPIALDGAREVQKYETPGAKHCLVHVEQVHQALPEISFIKEQTKIDQISANGSESSSWIKSNREGLLMYREVVRENLNEASTIQRDIETILLYLKNKNGLKSIRLESCFKDDSPQDCQKEITSRSSFYSDSGYTTKEEISNSGKYWYSNGAGRILGSKGLLEIKASENIDINSTSYLLVHLAKTSEERDKAIRVTSDIRENHVLDVLYSSCEPYSVVVFGVDHDFRDNLNKWDAQHPKDKFSLIVVTPKSYREDKK
ncbi:MAG: hypothetical protein AABX96_03785 [Nanoarchaeota archaeon]